MKKSKINLSLFLVIVMTMFLFSVMSVSAALTATLLNPAASSGQSGNFYLNVSLVGHSANVAYNCTFYASSSLTANSSWTILNGSVTNTTASFSNMNNTFDSTILEDADNYIFNVSCYDSDDDATISDRDDDTNTGITVDNTIPQQATGLTPTSDSDGSVTFSGTVVGVNTTSCTLLFDGGNPGASSYTMTHTGDTCSYTNSAVPEQTYRWYIRTSDETNTTDSSKQTTNVDLTSGNKLPVLMQEPGVRATGGATLSVASATVGPVPVWLIVVIITVVVIVYIRKK